MYRQLDFMLIVHWRDNNLHAYMREVVSWPPQYVQWVYRGKGCMAGLLY
jgi:hypothetical protein